MRKVFSLLFIASFLLMPLVAKAQPKLEKCNNGLVGGCVSSVLVSEDIIFAGTSQNGLYRSSDKGVTWDSLKNELSTTNINCLATTGKLLYAGTSSGCYISSDYGNTWDLRKSGIFDNYNVNCILIDSSKNVFMGKSNGIFYLGEKSPSWVKVNKGLFNTSIKCLAKYKDKILAGSEGSGVFISSDYGANWTASFYNLTVCDIRCLAVSGNNIFAGSKGGGVFVSTDEGGKWKEVNTGLTNLDIQTLKVIGTDLYAGTESGLFLSTDNGLSWVALDDGMSSKNILSIADKDNILYVGTKYGGICSSINSGKDWNRIDYIFDVPKVNCIVSNKNNIYVGTEGSNLYRSTNNGDCWESISGGIRGTSVGSMTLYNDSLYVVADDVYSSYEGNLKWKSIYKNCQDRYNSQIFTAGDEIFFTCYNTIYYANIYEYNWKHTGLTDLTCTAVLGDKIFAGKSAWTLKFTTYGGGIYSTTDHGTTWKYVAYDELYISKFLVQGTKLYAIINGGIHLTTDYGVTWKPCKINTQYNFIEMIGGNGKDIVSCNQNGEVFYSNDDGTNWCLLDTIRTITCFDFKGNNLFIGTTDKGIYRMDISDYVSVKDKPSAEEFSVYPNPAGDFITVTLGAINPTHKRGVDETSIQIYNMLSEKVMIVEQTPSSVQQINISDLPKGVYFIKVGERTAKFVKI